MIQSYLAQGLKQSWFLFELYTREPGKQSWCCGNFRAFAYHSYTLEQSFETDPLFFYAFTILYTCAQLIWNYAWNCALVLLRSFADDLEEQRLFTINCWQTCSRKSMAIVRYFDPSLEIHEVNNSSGCSRFDADGKSCLRCQRSKSNVRNPLGGL